jgi:hypothetical protein
LGFYRVRNLVVKICGATSKKWDAMIRVIDVAGLVLSIKTEQTEVRREYYSRGMRLLPGESMNRSMPIP